jgi:hypothetical protein
MIMCLPGHEDKLLSLLEVNALGLLGNWFWREWGQLLVGV